MVGKANCTMPSSGVKAEIARVLQEEGYITSFEVGGDVKKELTIELKYFNGEPVIAEIKRDSRPGLRN